MVIEPADGVGIDRLVASLDGIFEGDVIRFVVHFFWLCWLQCIATMGLSHSFHHFQFPFKKYSIHTGHDPRAISSYDVIINEDYFADSRLSTLP